MNPVLDVIILGAFLLVWFLRKRILTRTETARVMPRRAPADKGGSEIAKAVLRIPNTKAYRGSRLFVKGYGIVPSEIHDIAQYTQDEDGPLNAEIRAALDHCYQFGNARGLLAMQLLHHGLEFKKQFTLYFVLTSRGKKENAAVVAFVAAPLGLN